ncbi:MAG: ribose-phosphate diphosphokinase [Nanoarchaeota archaeon]
MCAYRSAHERAKRQKRLDDLCNAVLIDNYRWDSDRSHLLAKIHERVSKEFDNPSPEEAERVEGMKAKNLQFCSRQIKRHYNGESFVRVGDNVREKDVHLFFKFKLPKDPLLAEESAKQNEGSIVDSYLIQLCVTLDGLMRSGVNSITLYAPFLPYLRQDKKDDGRVPISAKMLFNLFDAAAAKKLLRRIVTFDLHADQEQGFWDGPVDALTASPDFAAYYRERLSRENGYKASDFANYVEVVAADAGGVKRTDKMARLLKCPWDVFTKLREAHSEADTRLDVRHNIKGKKLIIAEDIIDTCGSIAGKAEVDPGGPKEGPLQYLIGLGAEAHCCATHGVFSAKNGLTAEERLRQSGGKILIADTLQERDAGYYQENRDWLTVVSLDYVLAKAFFCNQVGDSISGFLSKRGERVKAEKLDFKIVSEGARYTVA